MNYIKHLSAFFEKIYSDNRLNPSHVSLYMALFQFWNLNRFENPFSIGRMEILQISKIGSLNTYHKCIHDLNEFGYIKYIPSHNPLKGSLVHLYNFDTTEYTTSDANLIQPLYDPRRKIDTTVDTSTASFYKHYKHINNKRVRKKKIRSRSSKNEGLKSEKQSTSIESRQSQAKKPKRKNIASKKEKVEIPPSIDQVKTFFKIEGFPDLEAHKFFNHFQSIGWKVGGKTPMEDWHAASHKWMLNNQTFEVKRKTGPYVQKKNKNYNEPL